MPTGSGKGATGPTSMQLNLFQWDLVEVGNGCRRLAALDFEQARDHFSRVLTALPNHQAAGEWLQTACYWQETFATLPTLEGETGVAYLWQRVRAFDFGGNANHIELRANLLRRLQAMMESASLEYLPPDLCRGFLTLQLGDYEAAEQQLRRLIESYPEDGLLYGYLADALWMQKRRELANSLYALALLLAPELMANQKRRIYMPCCGRWNWPGIGQITRQWLRLAKNWGSLPLRCSTPICNSCRRSERELCRGRKHLK